MRKCGDEVRELLHDGCPVACLGDAPFGYVNAFQQEFRERLAKIGLELHPDKTRLIEFGRFAARDRKERGRENQRPSPSGVLPTTVGNATRVKRGAISDGHPYRDSYQLARRVSTDKRASRQCWQKRCSLDQF